MSTLEFGAPDLATTCPDPTANVITVHASNATRSVWLWTASVQAGPLTILHESTYSVLCRALDLGRADAHRDPSWLTSNGIEAHADAAGVDLTDHAQWAAYLVGYALEGTSAKMANEVIIVAAGRY